MFDHPQNLKIKKRKKKRMKWLHKRKKKERNDYKKWS